MTENVHSQDPVEPDRPEGAESNQPALGFDVSSLRLSQDLVGAVGVKKAILTVPVRRPHRQDFVRVHPDPEFRIQRNRMLN